MISATSYAVFPVKTMRETTITTATESTTASLKQIHRPSRIARFFHIYDMRRPTDLRPGWPGIAALVCGAVGFFPGAIVFGIIGLGKRYKNHGLAIAGIILGVLDIVLLVVIVAAIISVFQVSMSGVI